MSLLALIGILAAVWVVGGLASEEGDFVPERVSRHGDWLVVGLWPFVVGTAMWLCVGVALVLIYLASTVTLW